MNMDVQDEQDQGGRCYYSVCKERSRQNLILSILCIYVQLIFTAGR
jgi:hypothetical protein